MFELYLVLTPIGLLDSASIVPLCLVFLVTLLAGPRPLLASSLHVAGVFIVYFGCGLLLLFGLQVAFEQLNAYVRTLKELQCRDSNPAASISSTSSPASFRT